MGTVSLDKLPDPALVVDASGVILACNSQAMALFGYGRLEGMAVEELLAPADRERHAAHRLRYNQAPRQRPMATGGILSARLASGAVAHVEISLGPLGKGRTIALIRDATHRIAAEAEYRATRTQLIDTQERMIGILGEDLREIAERVRALEGQ